MPPRPPLAHETSIVLFSYGTLRQGEVQDDVLGHRPIGWDDHLDGHRLDWITITDPEVVRLSGSDRHPALVVDQAGTVAGTAWRLTGADLAATDAYEVDEYARIEVTLRSGATAWVYTLAEVAP